MTNIINISKNIISKVIIIALFEYYQISSAEYFYLQLIALIGDPTGNRTPVSGVRGRRPRPLDDGTIMVCI